MKLTARNGAFLAWFMAGVVASICAFIGMRFNRPTWSASCFVVATVCVVNMMVWAG